MYHTGDLARRHRDGTLECLGRVDNQIKLRGFRIELGEIEAVIGDGDGVTQCVTIVREDRPGDERLVAYVVAEEGTTIDATALKASAAERLPGYMVPSAVVAIDSFPLTPNGKVDRLALGKIEHVQQDSAVGFVAPRDGREEALAAIWSEVLGVERIGAHDDFFALGGNSLLTTQAMARIRAAFEVDLPLRTLFEAPTLGELAAHLGTASPTKTATIQPMERDGSPLPLSFTQQRLWFLDQLEPEQRAVYNVWMAFGPSAAGFDEDVLRARPRSEIVPAPRGPAHALLRGRRHPRPGSIGDPRVITVERLERPGGGRGRRVARGGPNVASQRPGAQYPFELAERPAVPS